MRKSIDKVQHNRAGEKRTSVTGWSAVHSPVRCRWLIYFVWGGFKCLYGIQVYGTPILMKEWATYWASRQDLFWVWDSNSQESGAGPFWVYAICNANQSTLCSQCSGTAELSDCEQSVLNISVIFLSNHSPSGAMTISSPSLIRRGSPQGEGSVMKNTITDVTSFKYIYVC